MFIGVCLGCCALGLLSRGLLWPYIICSLTTLGVILLIINVRIKHAPTSAYPVQYGRAIRTHSQRTRCCCEQRLRRKTASSNHPLRPFRRDVRCESSFNSHLHLVLLHLPPFSSTHGPLDTLNEVGATTIRSGIVSTMHTSLSYHITDYVDIMYMYRKTGI